MRVSVSVDDLLVYKDTLGTDIWYACDACTYYIVIAICVKCKKKICTYCIMYGHSSEWIHCKGITVGE